jgi:Regulator of Chromosome Condensation (RCC1) repeat protein/carbohydrate binding protein with CBM4/9 domain/regulator of chromosome condensation (RCC1) repeat-containing protein
VKPLFLRALAALFLLFTREIMTTSHAFLRSLLTCLLSATGGWSASVTQLGQGGVYISGSYFFQGDGTLWQVGYINWRAYLGHGSQAVASNVTAIANNPRNDHTLYIHSDGSLWASGNNSFGELGDGTTGSGTTAPELIVASNVTAIAVGQYHSLFVKADGSLWAMGNNDFGELGDGTTTSRSKPELIVAGGVRALAAGVYHSVFLKTDGSLWAMGWNRDGQLGDGSTTSKLLPEQILAGGVTQITAEENDSLFIKADGSLWGMGDNYYGQLGFAGGSTPQMIVASNVTAVAGGQWHTLFLTDTDWDHQGALWTMGDNWAGQLGDGTLINTRDGGPFHKPGPVQVLASGVKAIAAGANSSTFLKTDGTIWAMGMDYYNGNDLITAPQPVYPQVLFNGDFESGDFLGWTTGGNFMNCAVDTNSLYAHRGTYGAKLGSSGTPGALGQTVPTTPGATYRLSLWLDNPAAQGPNLFQVSWDGTIVLNLQDLGYIGWTNIQLLVRASQASTELQFSFQNDSAWLGLDDIQLSPAEPGIGGVSLAEEVVRFNVANGMAGRSYQILSGSDLRQATAQWSALATNTPATDGNFTITATNALTPGAPRQNFYRVKLL